MNNALLDDVKTIFPNYKAKSFKYIPIISDLDQIFDIVNKHVFKNRLDRSLIEIIIQDYNFKGNKGTFSLIKSKPRHTLIRIFKSSYGDNFGQIFSVFCHEMIHVYDRYFGPLKEHISKFRNEEYLDIKNVENRQIIEGYDGHGKYFKEWIDKFLNFGVFIKVNYKPTDNRLMKENEYFRRNELKLLGINSIDENANDIDIENKNRLQAFVNSIKGCDGELTYVDDENWIMTFA